MYLFNAFYVWMIQKKDDMYRSKDFMGKFFFIFIMTHSGNNQL